MTAIFQQQAVEVLKQCREQLEEFVLTTPLNIESYREEIIHGCHIAVDLWNELKACETRILELESSSKTAKDMPNKMEYSKAANELLVVRKKSKELSREINKEIRASSFMVENTKRVKVEMDRLDDTLRIAQLELFQSSEADFYGVRSSTLSLQAEAEIIPPKLVREQLITQNNSITKSLEEVRDTLHREKEEHRELVADLQFEIKTIRDYSDAMTNGTYVPALEFESRVINRRRSLTNNMNKQRDTIQNEIELIQVQTSDEGKMQDATISSLRNEQSALEERLAHLIQYNSTSMQDIEKTLYNLHQEQSNITAVLHQLALRVAKEEEEKTIHAEMERTRLYELEVEKAMDEREYFAALWIQLRWKAYCKRRTLKHHNQKIDKKIKKGGAAGGGSKK